MGVKRATAANLATTYIVISAVVVPIAVYYKTPVWPAFAINLLIHIILIAPTYQTYKLIDELHFVRSKLYQSAITDYLTQVYNRQHFIEYLEWHFASARRWGLPFAVILLDIDHFKAINDRYGHEAGDEALRVVSAMCQAQVRQTDIFARYGGEEFSFLLAQITAEQALAFAERICVSIGQAPINCGKVEIPITVSLGVATYHEGLQDIDALLSAADKAMYQAKRQGRNQAVLAERPNN